MTVAPDTGADDILTEEDYELILRSVLTQAGRAGLLEEDVLRRSGILAAHVREWKVGAAMYKLFADGKARMKLTDDESDVVLVLTEDGQNG